MDTLVETPWGEDSDEDDVIDAPASDEEIENPEHESIEEKETHDVLALPIRAKPLFMNNNEEVVEFTLTESNDGMESTSIIVGEGLFRIVETKMHQDGIPRIDLKLALDSELTGFQHIVEKPSTVEMGASAGLFLVGLVLCIFPYQFTMIVGISAILFGIKLAPQHLEKHRLVFSSCGSTHVFDIDLNSVFKPTFRASMALLGPTLAEYMKTGDIDSSSIDELHAGLRAPIPAHEPMLIEAPSQMESQIPIGPPVIAEIPIESTPQVMEIATPNIPSPAEFTADEEESEILSEPAQVVSIPPPPQVVPQPNPLPPPPVIPQPNPLPPPPAISQPNPLPPPPAIPQPNPLPPPPAIPQPNPLPPPPVMMPNQPPMQGFDSASLPLDAPLPEAPRIPVAAAPQQQTISQEEQDALMDELS